MDYCDSLLNKYVLEQWQTVKEGHGHRLVIHDFQRQVIDFEVISEVTDAFSISISMNHNYNLMPSSNRALCQAGKCGFPHLPYLGRKSQMPYIYYGYGFYVGKDFQG